MKNKNVLIMLLGLPASGKTTYAMELVEKGCKRVNKDELRAMIDGGKWSKEKEKTILETEKQIVKNLLTSGYNVVVDDTNFAHRETWSEIAKECDADFSIKDFTGVSPRVCIERDIARGSKVGAKVILDMYNRYVKPEKIDLIENIAKQQVFIFDIDGTLAHMDGRHPHEYNKVSTDKLDKHVAMILSILSMNFKIIFVSGRKDSCRHETAKWIEDNITIYYGDHELFMRKYGDNRSDDIVKKEIYQEHIENKYTVLGVFDDRDRVVDMWRSLGLTCYQVGLGNF